MKTFHRTLVTATPPTPNGDMHLGHLSGPYLNADVYCRHLRRSAHPVRYVTGGDDNQSYLVTTAQRLGRSPAQTAAGFNHRIVETLEALEIELDLYSIPDAEYGKFVNDFFLSLYRRGHLVAKTKDFWFCKEHQRFLYEGYTKGSCPLCLSIANGNICETCGHPNHPGDLIDARCSAAPDHPLERRPLTLLYLELERYRDALAEFHEAAHPLWRPHLRALARQLLANPLLDLPVTFPAAWGISVPLPGFAGQVWNSWAEMFPALLFAGKRAAAPLGEDVFVAQFLGFDNAYWFCAAHPAFAVAADMPAALPDWILTNEFYLLDNEKFSTSRNHAIWGGDFLKECPPTHLRFYLAITNPELQQTNFALAEMEATVNERLVAPWNRLLASLQRLEASHGRAADQAAPASETADALSQIGRTIEQAYEPDGFSLRAAAEATATLIATLADYSEHGERMEPSGGGVPDCLRTLRHGLRVLAASAAPLLPSFCRALTAALADDGPALQARALESLKLPSISMDPSLRRVRRAA